MKPFRMMPIITKIEKIIHVDRKCYENMNIVEYNEGDKHNAHYNAYDMNSDVGKKNTTKLGQRILTISLFLTDNMQITFPSIKVVTEYKQGDVLIYKNTQDNSVQRDQDLGRTIVSMKGTGYLANIYVRLNNQNGSNTDLVI